MSETITNPFVGQVVLYQGEPYKIVRVDADVCFLSNNFTRADGQGIKRAKVHYAELSTRPAAPAGSTEVTDARNAMSETVEIKASDTVFSRLYGEGTVQDVRGDYASVWFVGHMRPDTVKLTTLSNGNASAGKPLPGDQIIIRDGSEHDGEIGMILPGGDHGYYKVAPDGSGIDVHHAQVEALPGDAAPDELTGTEEETDVEFPPHILLPTSPDEQEYDPDAPDELATLRAERDALVQRNEAFWQEIERLRAALMPFALAAEDYDVRHGGEHNALSILDNVGDYTIIIIDISYDEEDHAKENWLDVSHLRAAADALKGKQS